MAINIFLFANFRTLGQIFELIGPGAVIAIGWLVEKDYTGKFVTFANAMAVNLAFAAVGFSAAGSTLDFTHWAIVAYLDLGLVMGVLGLLSFTEKIKLPPVFDSIAMAYSTIPAALMVLISLVF